MEKGRKTCVEAIGKGPLLYCFSTIYHMSQLYTEHVSEVVTILVSKLYTKLLRPGSRTDKRRRPHMIHPIEVHLFKETKLTMKSVHQ